MKTSLYSISEDYRGLLALDDPEIPEEAIQDTLEALEGELIEKGQSVAAYMLNLESEAALIKQAEDKMSRRRKALENKAKSIHEYLRQNMVACGIEKISCPEFELAIRKNGSQVVVIDNMDELPEEFKTEKTTVSADKSALKKALKEGSISGARLEINDTLTKR